MANIFTCGLRDKVKNKKEPAPRDLVEAVKNLRAWPGSKRICREALDVARRILDSEVRPVPWITRRAVVVFNCDGRQSALEYLKEPRMKLENGYGFCDSFHFHALSDEPGAEDEVCITREGGFAFDDEQRVYYPKKPVTVEFLKDDLVLASYDFGGEA